MGKIRALIIDDSESFQRKVKDLLQQAGFIASYAVTGQEGLQMASQQQFDLVCCNYHLPDIAGGDLCGKLRALPGYDFTSVIVLTTDNDPRILKQALLAGATDIFMKPNLSELDIYLRRFAERVNRTLSGRVLFIEDSRVLQEVIMDLLTDMGLDVDSYTEAEAAWDALAAGHYDLVITDIMLSGAMTGVSLIRQIRRLNNDKGQIPVIAISGFDNVSRKIELFHLGVNDYIAKPVIREELRQRVYNHITAYQSMLELKAQQSSLYSLSMLDALTRLFNRHALREFSKKYFANAIRLNRDLTMAVLDIDAFNNLNTRLDRMTGDKVLAEFGIWLKRYVQTEDIVARWSGDEFVILLPDCTVNEAITRMQQLQKSLQQFKPGDEIITVSIGLAALTDEAQTLSSLFEQADSAMYQAKLAGRNTIRVYQGSSDIEE